MGKTRTKKSSEPKPVEGPIVCKPLGELPLSEIRAFPPRALAHLRGVYDIVTLGQLEPFVRETPDPKVKHPIRQAMEDLKVPADVIDQATFTLCLHLGQTTDLLKTKNAAAEQKVTEPGPKPEATPTPSAPSKPPEQFDESTPPPRSVVLPLRAYMKLPKGASAVAEFLGWSRAGRVPPGSVLTEFSGSCASMNRCSYRVAQYQPGLEQALGSVNQDVSDEQLEPFRLLSAVVEVALPRVNSKTFAIFAPREGRS